MPCDIYAEYGTQCVAAYSMDRALYSSYDGPLYQVRRASDGTTANIGLLSTGGYVDAAEQDSFCAGTSCTVTELYDQSPEGNNLTIEGAGGAAGADHGAPAAALPITVDGYPAYGLDIMGHTGYRDDSTRGIAVNGEAEGMYMVASGTNVNSGCCFDFGNAETNNHDTGASHMDAVNLTTYCEFSPCNGPGPWVEADMENGQYVSGDGSNPNDTSNNNDFVTAMLSNNGQNTFELQGGNAQSGGLTTYW
ncbi:MAG: arabinofuranosidase catalytic domain-containing protein, partial [Streptosporangiaceae bacterium]